MSNTSSGSFTPYQYSGNKSRMAGDYLKDFTKQSGSNLSSVLGYRDDNNEDASTATNRSTTDLRGGVKNSSSSSSNVSKVLTGNNSNTSFSKPASTPAKTAQPQTAQPQKAVGADDSGIDFAAWAADTASGNKSGGQDAAYWEKTYRQNYAEDQERKAKFDAYNGIKTNEEFEAANQANWDMNSKDINAYNSQMHKDYGEFSTYATLKSQQGHFDKYADKWRKK